MGGWAVRGCATMIVAFLVVASLAAMAPMAPARAADPVAVNQGVQWDAASRDAFYSLDQGSRIIPLRWIMALKLPDGSPFMADDLRRYGFLPNDASPARLPVGFSTGLEGSEEFIGMTCAACHTRQIEVAGTAYRIDGGPAIIDFQTFLSDLDVAVDKVLTNEAAFADFAQAVLGSTRDPSSETALRENLNTWHVPHKTLMLEGLPRNPWGLGRSDAVGMIFNRLTGLDIGTGPDGIMEINIQHAEAPVRSPFLWNAANQEWTQWPGFACNADPRHALARNVGQAIGVFAKFFPRKNSTGGIDYWASNSINPRALFTLEALMKSIGTPRWPWDLDNELAKRGKDVYSKNCFECHNDEPGAAPWPTRVEAVGTDNRQIILMDRPARTGVLEGEKLAVIDASTPPDMTTPLKEEDPARKILSIAVVNSLVQRFGPPPADRQPSGTGKVCVRDFSGEFDFTSKIDLSGLNYAFPVTKPGYEARVLHGIWAAAPYLHNGSVSTLAELLKPAAQRKPTFQVGPVYDPVEVGLAEKQGQFSSTMTTTDCSDRSSGNSRCGHEFGTDLSDTEKKELLEYLKRL